MNFVYINRNTVPAVRVIPEYDGTRYNLSIICIEINSRNVTSDTELDGGDESIESDSSSNESRSFLSSKQTVEQRPNAWPPSSLSVPLSDDDDECQVVFECCSQPPLHCSATINPHQLHELSVSFEGGEMLFI